MRYSPFPSNALTSPSELATTSISVPSRYSTSLPTAAFRWSSGCAVGCSLELSAFSPPFPAISADTLWSTLVSAAISPSPPSASWAWTFSHSIPVSAFAVSARSFSPIVVAARFVRSLQSFWNHFIRSRTEKYLVWWVVCLGFCSRWNYGGDCWIPLMKGLFKGN